MYTVIMGGGSGKRFWPKSREDLPKQFLKIAGEDSMIKSTFSRVCKVVSPEKVFVVTHERFRQKVLDEIGELNPLNVIAEPKARNTAPCIALSLFYLNRFMPEENILFIPADHLVPDTEEFVATVKAADSRVKKTGGAVVFGIKPRYPETGYGYIRMGKKTSGDEGRAVFEVNSFVEKPERKKAEEYLKSGDYLWNSGMFLFNQKRLMDSFKKFLPQIYEPFNNMDFGKKEDFSPSKMDFYSSLENVSIDKGIIEKESGLELIEGTFKWSDVGSWRALEEIWPKDKNGNAIKGKYFLKKSSGLIADIGKKFLVSMGVKDLIIIDSEDTLFICAKGEADKMKDMLEEMKESGFREYL